MDQEAADRGSEMDDLKMKLMRENLYLKSLAGKPLSVYFDAYRTKAYDGGGEENLTFNVSSTCLDLSRLVLSCPDIVQTCPDLFKLVQIGLL